MRMRRYLHDRKILIIVLLISFTLFGLVSITAIQGDPVNNGNNSTYKSNPVLVKVLIYDGDGVIPGSVYGIEDCLNDTNKENIYSGVYFNYSTIGKIDSGTLSGYDVLIMPGGLATTYLENPDINSGDLKDFVNNGGGYVGICAGSYAASSHVDGYYDGWGIAPHVNSKSVDYVGELQISMTSNGMQVLNSSDKETLYHWNGPAMYGSNSMAEYAHNETGYQNYSAVMTDTYGSGRVMLSGPHPELNPKDHEMLVRMILWASKKI